MEKLDIDMEYLSLYAKKMSASAVKAGEDEIIVMDELLMYREYV